MNSKKEWSNNKFLITCVSNNSLFISTIRQTPQGCICTCLMRLFHYIFLSSIMSHAYQLCFILLTITNTAGLYMHMFKENHETSSTHTMEVWSRNSMKQRHDKREENKPYRLIYWNLQHHLEQYNLSHNHKANTTPKIDNMRVTLRTKSTS